MFPKSASPMEMSAPQISRIKRFKRLRDCDRTKSVTAIRSVIIRRFFPALKQSFIDDTPEQL
jgi:hypothetical protein